MARTDPAAADRLPPASPEAEQGVLGCILLSPADCMGECLMKLKAGAQVFYDLRHQTIYDCLAAMYDARQPIDLLTVRQKLKDAGRLDDIGGIAYLSALPDTVPTAANLDYYLEILHEKYLLRKTLQVCVGTAAKIYDSEAEVEPLLDAFEAEVLKIRQSAMMDDGKNTQAFLAAAMQQVETFHTSAGALTGIASGFVDLDKLTRGFQRGDMIVIAARPSVGKTSLAMNIAEHVSVQLGLPTAVFSLEMTGEALGLRLLCSHARVNVRMMQDGFLQPHHFERLSESNTTLTHAPLFIDDHGGLSIMQLRARARRLHQQHGIKLFVVDYLQLLHSTNRRADNRQQEIADISGGIKALAKELNVPIIVLSQLNREVERDRSRKPRLSDLRESGAIEQDADIVGLLYRPAKDEDEPYNAVEVEAEPIHLLVAKQRNGPTGDVALTFIKGYTRFESAAKVSDEDVPHSAASAHHNDP